MRVALVITGLGVGGAERVVVDLADALFRNGHQVILVVLTGSCLVLPQEKSIPITNLRLNSIQDIFSACVRLRRVLALFAPDVVHSHMVHANLLCRFMRPFLKSVRLISSAHNADESRARFLAYRLTDRFASISTNVSAEAVSAYVHAGAVSVGRMIVVHNGIDTDVFQFSEADRKLIRGELSVGSDCKMILAVGRLVQEKDYANLINSLAFVKNSFENFKLFIAGDGPQRYEISNLINALELQDRVFLLGLRRDISKLMSAADVFVLPSFVEGFGVVVAEAMACERVVVATDCGGVKEVMGQTGMLVPRRKPAALADSLVTAMSLSHEEAFSIGRSSRRRILELFSMPSFVSAWLSIYAGTSDFLYRPDAAGSA